jgi:hypothetical protein
MGPKSIGFESFDRETFIFCGVDAQKLPENEKMQEK